MNALCYKIVFSKRLGTLVAVGEHTAGQGKAAGTGVRTAVFPSSSAASVDNFVGLLKAAFASVAMTFVTVGYATAAGPAANTLPTGYRVNSGNVAISSTSSATNAAMTIQQTTDKASINWQSFSIGSGAKVDVVQNNANSVLLNRVVGNDPSQIFGKLTANGQVILINPNGVVFGKGGSVTASAFAASTFGMTDADFMAGKHKFSRNGSTAGVTVEDGARIDTTGYVALIGASVDNQGAITTKGGAVVLASGEQVGLPSELTDNISVPLSGKVRLELLPSTINAMVANSGTITTEGGQVLMQAAAVSDAVASITHTGTIDTTGEQGGAVTLQADHGIIKATGKIKANSKNAKSKGGDIIIGRNELTGVLAKVTDVSGAKLESLGGFVETSGEYLETKAVSVLAKDWLLDPTDINIVDGDTSTANTPKTLNTAPVTGLQTFQQTDSTSTSEVLKADIEQAINNGTNVTITTTNSQGNGEGNITIKTKLNFTNNEQDATLKLKAENGITQETDASITNSGSKLVHVEMTAEGLPKGTNSTDSTFDASKSKGIVLNSSITTNGDVTLEGTTFSGERNAVQFADKSSIQARKITVTGTNKSTIGGAWDGANASGVMFRGANISLTSLTGDSLVKGSTKNSNGQGIYIWPSTLGLNAGTGTLKLESAADSLKGVRVGFSGGVTINSTGNVTIGSHNSDTSGLFFQGTKVNASSGTLTLIGKSSSGIGVDFSEGGGNLPFIDSTNSAKVIVNGFSTNNIAVKLGSGGKTTITSATGSITLKGESTNSTGIFTQSNSEIKSTTGKITLYGVATGVGVGVSLSNGIVTTGGVNEITGTSQTGDAIIVNSNVTIEGASVALKGTSTSGAGVSGTGKITATTGNVQIDGLTTTGGTGGSVSTNNNITASNGDININGTTATANKEGVFIGGNTINAKNIKIVGFSTGAEGAQQKAKGISSSGTLIASESITLEGTSQNVTGVGIETGSITAGGAVVIKAITNTGQYQGANIGGAVTGNSVSITGNSSNHYGVMVSSAVTATNGGVDITGTTTSATTDKHGVVVNGNIKATNGDVTIKGTSDNGYGVHVNAGNVTSLGITPVDPSVTNSTAKASAITINGVSNGKNSTNASVGAQIQNTVIAAGKLTITGETKGVGNYQGVNIARAVSGETVAITGNAAKNIGVSIQNTGSVSSTGAAPAEGSSIVINGTSTGTDNAGVSVAGTVSGQSVLMTGITSGNVGVDINAAVTSTEGDIKLTGTGGNNYYYGQGVWTHAAGTLKSEKGGITIIGKSIAPGNNQNVIGSQIQGAVTAAGDIVVEGRNTGANTPKTGLSIENTIKSTGGNITVTAENTSGTDQALRLTGAGKLETVDNTKTININTNGLDLQGTVKAGSTGAGSVHIKTVGTDNAIDIGGADGTSNYASAQKLGISNTELNKITAGNVVIGDTSKNGNITVSQTTTTKDSTGHITLQTRGNIAVNAALTVGVGPTTTVKNLTLNGAAAGSNTSAISQNAAGVIKAAGLKLLGANAMHTLTNVNNQVATLAANSKAIDYVNKTALTLGAINATTGINATGNVSIATQAGNLTISENVNTTASTATALVLNAGKSSVVGAAVGADMGGNIVVSSGKTVGVGAGGVAKLMTGSITGDTSAAGLAAAGNFRYNSGESNRNYNTELSNGVNVIYREKPTLTVNVTSISKTYDGLTFTGGYDFTEVTPSGLKNGDALTSATATAVYGGTAQNAKNASYTPYTLSASESSAGKSALGYGVTYNSGTLTVAKKSLTAQYAANNKVFDGNTNAVVTAVLNDAIVPGDDVTFAKTSATFDTASVGTNKTVTVSGIALGGADKSNYSLNSTTATAKANITAVPVPPPTPVVPSGTTARVKIPVGSSNPFALASAEDLSDDVCTANSIENCYCEESTSNQGVDICYEPKAGAKGSVR